MFGVIGECMVELRAASDPDALDSGTTAHLGYGGDTLNTAVYLARAGVDVSYATALGDDQLSAWLLREWQQEGVDCSDVFRLPGAVPGLYMIHVDERGERSFSYWRKDSPASRLLDEEDRASKVFASLFRTQYLYYSGITLAIYSSTARQRLFTFLKAYRAAGGCVCFDNNYRPGLWASAGEARAAYKQAYCCADIALPTNEDEQLLFGPGSDDETIHRLQNAGVKEIVLKQGPDGCRVISTDGDKLVPASRDIPVTDSTAAGDSFNAGYLAARVKGQSPTVAATEGNALAGRVIQHRGAILPR